MMVQEVKLCVLRQDVRVGYMWRPLVAALSTIQPAHSLAGQLDRNMSIPGTQRTV